MTGLGGSSDPIAVTLRGGANNAHRTRKPGLRVPGGGAATARPPGSIFIKSFFIRPSLFLFASVCMRFLLRLRRSPSLSLSLLSRVYVSISFPPCRAYNVRPDRTWIRRRAGSFLMDIFGYPHRLESDLWTTSVHRLRFLGSFAQRAFSTRVISYTCVCFDQP